MKEEDTPVKISKMKEHTQVKEEGVDVSVTPDIKADTPNNAEVQFAKSETPKTTSDSELILSPPTADVSVKQSIDDDEWNEADRASSPDQGPSVEVIVNLEQPARDEKRCRFCGKNFRKDSSLIWHVNRTHKGQKAFKCLKCNMEFDQRSQLVKHTRKHTAVKKSFKCDFCERTFSQNSSCIVHMRVHTGEKPYFCKNCGKSFAYSGHLKFCNFQSKLKSPPEKVKPEETLKEEKRFSCSDCSKEFRYKYQLVEHIRIHTGEKPYGCGICGKTYAHISARNSHLKAHSTEKPYFCKNCGRSFKRKRHLQFCTSREKTFRCETCGKTFYTKSQLDVHFEVHEAWKRHIREKVQESKLEDKSPTSLHLGIQHHTLQPNTMKEEDTPVQISEMKEHTQVKEEDVDVSITPDIKKETSNSAEVPKSEPTSDSELFPSSPTAEESVNQSIDDDEWNEVDGASSPDQGPSIEVIVNLEQPARDEKMCRFCGRNFRKDSSLIWHVHRTHKGQKAFKCLKCNMEFDQRSHLVNHTKKHTAVKKSFKCDFCDRTFAQNSGCIVHMRVHTGEKPYFCKNCGKSFAISKHLKLCKLQNKFKRPSEKVDTEENLKEEKRFSCFGCSKEFRYKYQLIQHARIHTGEKPFSCEICGKTFAQSSTRNTHLRVHSKEKPYFCKNCGISFRSKEHLKFCTSKSREKTFRCETCGKTFHTRSQLEVHFEVHEAWKQHIVEKVQESKLEDKNPTSL